MAAEEDKRFDKVLGGFLVNDLRIRAGGLHCPESDTLAAYHERSLLPEEMNSWKEHIVGCARCQAILSELEATDSISLQASEKEEILIAAAASAGAGAEPIPPRREATASLPERARVTPISRGVRWQWLAPAGALAAGLLVWVAWHENRRPHGKAPAEVTTAKLEPPATPLPSVTRDDRQSISADEAARLSKEQGAIGGAGPAKPATEAKTPKQFEKSDSRAKVVLARPTTGESSKGLESSMPPADKEAGARADTALDSLSAGNRAQNQPAQNAKAGVAGAVSQTVEVQTPAANAQPQNQQAQQNLQAQQNQLNEQKVSGPNPSRVAEAAKKRKSESPATGYRAAAAAPQPAPPPATAFSDSAALRMAAAISPAVIAAPGRKSLWRAGHAGMIEFSADDGASWLRQTSNVFADLTAGSAPSDKVCWIVGRAGTILLTTDAGAHWAAIHSPLDEDLGGVRATDARHATIWNLANTKVLETSDGGVTWKPARSQ
jgi:hypothetical protein